MRTFEYRLYPNRAQRQQLMACLTQSRALYNEMLADLKAQYEEDGTFPMKYDLTARFKGRGGDVVPATTVQALADRLSKALRRFLQRKDLGFPWASPVSRRPTAGTPSSCASTPSVEMSGWMIMASICTYRPSWGACSRSSGIVRSSGRR